VIWNIAQQKSDGIVQVLSFPSLFSFSPFFSFFSLALLIFKPLAYFLPFLISIFLPFSSLSTLCFFSLLSQCNSGKITCATFSERRTRIGIGTKSGKVLCYSLENRSCQNMDYPGKHEITSVCFSESKKGLVAAANKNGSVYIWNYRESASLHHAFPNAHKSSVSEIIFSPKEISILVSVGADGALNLYDVDKKT